MLVNILFLIPLVVSQVIQVQQNGTSLIPYVTGNPVYGTISPFDWKYSVYKAPLSYEGTDWVPTSNGTVTIEIYKDCEIQYQYIGNWGEFNSLPYPDVVSDQFNWNITVAYMRENISYSIDLCDDISSCRTRQVTGYRSAPTSTFPYALNNATYPAYDVSNSFWSLRPGNCSTVTYSSNFTLDSLVQCKGSTYCVNASTSGTPFIDYTGTLRVYAAKEGTMIQRWEYPFNFRYNSVAVVISSQNVLGNVRYTVTSLIDSDGKLLVRIGTTTSSSDKYLSNPILDPSLVLMQNPVNSQSQVWDYKSVSVLSVYSGSYQFSWTLVPDSVSVSIRVYISLIRQVPVPQQYTLNTKLRTYRDQGYSITSSGPFSPNDRVYVASSVPHQSLVPDIRDVWLCYSQYPEYVPQYDPSKGLFGCKQPNTAIPASNILQLFKDGTPISDARFTITVNNSLFIEGYPASGFSLTLVSQVSDDRVYYVHVETRLSPRSRTRHSRESTEIASNIASFYVSRQDLYVRLNTQISAMYSLISVLAVLVLLLIAILIGYCTLGRKIRQIRKSRELKRLIEKRYIFLREKFDTHVKPDLQKIETIDEVLENPVLLKLYYQFCLKENRLESLMFYLSVKDLERQEDMNLRQIEFDRIVSDYIVKGSKYELNIKDEMRENVGSFDTIMNTVKLEMQMDSLKRFLKQLDLVDEMQKIELAEKIK